jgi:methyl-accepting chemotaxis protein
MAIKFKWPSRLALFAPGAWRPGASAQPSSWRLGEVPTLALIGLFFAVPLALLTYLLLGEQRRDIDFVEGKLTGLEYAAPLRALTFAVADHRGWSIRDLSGDVRARGPREQLAASMREATAKIDRIDALEDRALGLAGQWKAVRAQWLAIEADHAKLTLAGSLARHAALLEALTDLQSRVERGSALAMDQDPATHYLASAASNLIALGLRVAALETQATLAAQERVLTPERRDALASGLSAVQTELARARVDLQAALSASPDARIVLSDPSREMIDQTEVFMARVRVAFLQDEPSEAEKSVWLSENMRVIDTVAELSAAASELGQRMLRNRVEKLRESRAAAQLVNALFVALAVFGLVFVGRKLVESIRQRKIEAQRVAEENRRNQAAILRLMDEMAVIADGDLTASAAVTEEITGAIADSVNVTVEQLRDVVASINQSADDVAAATRETRQITDEIKAAAELQAQEIVQAETTVQQIARSVGEVSTSAAASAEVARASRETTERGAKAVQDAIAGMDSIRGQIQETSKRIKRLGESSQQIGEIVDLIGDITEQTNVLALNAAIQAAAAGEAGRGFAVVAEEVQRLAERSGEATRQIAALVKTIQLDTQDAVSAMEHSTQGVVRGAQLADAAGQALREIEDVTRDMAELIQLISASTQSQVDIAQGVRVNMRDILQMTDLATERTGRASEVVKQLTDLATRLKGSVSRFKVA